jgi:hypothetical protein
VSAFGAVFFPSLDICGSLLFKIRSSLMSEDLEINGLKEVKVSVDEFVDTHFANAESASANSLSGRLKAQVLTPNTTDANIIEAKEL